MTSPTIAIKEFEKTPDDLLEESEQITDDEPRKMKATDTKKKTKCKPKWNTSSEIETVVDELER